MGVCHQAKDAVYAYSASLHVLVLSGLPLSDGVRKIINPTWMSLGADVHAHTIVTCNQEALGAGWLCFFVLQLLMRVSRSRNPSLVC